MLIRLDKLISDSGKYSRSEARRLIQSGRVSVDGATARSAEQKCDTEKSAVFVDGAVILWKKFRYIMLDKPAGVLSATTDKSQPTVLGLLPEEYRKLRLAPVGRLDKDTTGLLIITDDGDYAHRVMSPGHDVVKRYFAEIDGNISDADVRAFSEGMTLADGTKCLPAGLEAAGDGRCFVEICEGKYHQVKRMLAARGKPVTALRRLSIGMLQIDEDLDSGGYREMEDEEAQLVFQHKNMHK